MDIWKITETEKEDIKYHLNLSGFKVAYDIEKFTGNTITKAIAASGYTGVTRKILTGKAGLILMDRHKDPFIKITQADPSLDPAEGNYEFNPVVGYYRLSSYTFIVYIGEDIVKIIPKNPLNKLEI